MTAKDSRCPYAVLGVPASATQEEIKRSYRRLALKHHPDKCAATVGTSSTDAAAVFAALQKAWETLRDPEVRAAHDAATRLAAETEESVRTTSVRDEVDLDDFDFDEAAGAFFKRCRCGCEMSITEDDLERGADLVHCSGCSIVVRVLYDVVDEDEGEDEDERDGEEVGGGNGGKGGGGEEVSGRAQSRAGERKAKREGGPPAATLP
jgi:diphthamide biosynthesis protein 4